MEIEFWNAVSNGVVEQRSSSTNARTSLIDRYTNYADKQSDQKIYWYLKSIIILPSAVMVPGIIWMSMGTDNYIWFASLCVVLFFLNLLAHISEVKSRYYIPLYHLSIALMIIIPLITNLI